MKAGKILFYFLSLTSLSLALVFGFNSKLCQIKIINCQMADEACPKDLEQKLAQLANKSLLFTNLELEISQALGTETAYQLESITKKIPSQINLRFKQETQVYLVKLGSELFLVDQDGYLTKNEINSDKKIINLNSDLQEKTLAEKKLPLELHLRNLDLIQGLEANKIRTNNIKSSEDMFLLELEDNKQAIISKDPFTATQKLALILEKFNFSQSESPIREIDLRFNLPVLRADKSHWQILD